MSHLCDIMTHDTGVADVDIMLTTGHGSLDGVVAYKHPGVPYLQANQAVMSIAI